MTIALWPTLTVADVDASLAFYSQVLGFKPDLRMQDDSGATFMGSVEVGDSVIMFETPRPDDPPTPNRGARSGVVLTICFPTEFDLDGLFNILRSKGIAVACEIGNRPWGNRDFALRDPDGYHLVLAKPAL